MTGIGVSGIVLVMVAGLVCALGVAGLVLFIVGLVKRRPALWGTGLGLVAPVLLLVGVGVLVGGLRFLIARPAAGRVGQARAMAAKSDLANVATALEMFQLDFGRYPTSEEGLGALMQAPAEATRWRGPYLRNLPRDPWGNAFVYRCPGQHKPTAFDLHSFGPDGRDGGGDDIDNWSGK